MLSKKASSTIFKVFGMTRPRIEPRSPRPLANTLTITGLFPHCLIKTPKIPNRIYIIIIHSEIFQCKMLSLCISATFYKSLSEKFWNKAKLEKFFNLKKIYFCDLKVLQCFGPGREDTICQCLPPDKAWHKVKSPKAE